MRSALEEDNDRMVADLERKVAALKGATQSIHDEVSDQNRMLGGMVRAGVGARRTRHVPAPHGWMARAGRPLPPADRPRMLASPSHPIPVQADDFDRTGGLMGGTIARLDGLVKYAGGSGHMCRLIVFVVAAFVALYWLVGRR